MRNKTLIVKITEREQEIYWKLAKSEHLSLSEYFRTLARQQAKKKGLWPQSHYDNIDNIEDIDDIH